MELVSTMEISGEEREIADAYARGQIATNTQNIATNAEGIADLNSNLDGLGYGENGVKNLFDKSKSTIGMAIGSSGKPYTNSEFGYSDYIEISSNTSYTYSNFSWYNFYDSNKSHISQGALVTSTSPSNAKYVVISFMLSKIDKLQLEEGDTATPYKPYIPSVKMLADEVSAQKNDLYEKLKVISVSLSDVMVSAMSSTTVDLPQEYIDAGYVIANILSKPDTGLSYTTGSETSIIIRNNTDSAVAFAPTTTVKVLIAKIG